MAEFTKKQQSVLNKVAQGVAKKAAKDFKGDIVLITKSLVINFPSMTMTQINDIAILATKK